MVLGWWFKGYRQLQALEELRRNNLWDILQQWQGALAKQMGKTYPASQVFSRLLAPKGVEPEASELGRSRGLLTYLQPFPAGQVQQDGVLQGYQEHTAPL